MLIYCLPVLKDREDDPEIEDGPELYYLLLVPNGYTKHIRLGEILASPETPHVDEYRRAGVFQMRINNQLAFKHG